MDSPTTSQAVIIQKNSDNYPSDVFKWIKANAKPQMALKLMRVCKFFRHKKFPYIAIKGFSNYTGTWNYCLSNEIHATDSLDIFSDSSLWITNYLFLYHEDNLVKSLLPKIAACEAPDLLLDSQKLTLQEFKTLTADGKFDNVQIYKTTIMDADKPASLEMILHYLPSIKSLHFDTTVPSIISSKTLVNLPLSQLERFRITHASETFDFSQFTTFIKARSFVHFNVSYGSNLILSPEYFQQLEKYTYKIIMNDSIDSPPPMIEYPGQTSKDALQSLYNQYREQHGPQRMHAGAWGN